MFLMRKKKLLITGASGLVGGHLFARAAKQDRWKVVPHYFQHEFNIMKKQGYRCDLTDRQEVETMLKTVNPDAILNTAANSNLDSCEKEPGKTAQINVIPPSWFAEYAQQNKARLIHISSDMVFDGVKGMYKESDEVSPLSVYGRSKVESEEAVLQRCPGALIARSALIYGRAQYGGFSFSMWIEKRLHRGDPVPLFRDQFRTPVLVDNLAAALLELADNDCRGILHLGGSERCNRLSFALTLCDVFNYNSDLLQSTSMHDTASFAPRPVDVSFNISRAQQNLRTELLDVKAGLQQIKRGV
ncbi:sugar nucleotide-binding protein [candidate division KSB1 bacterium]|nr:sugar nucleotide-binding protein [candidate division KSB1 bacterium]